MCYNGNPSSTETIALVGKGITFDTGGLNLKGTGFMENMHMDKCGSVAVLSSINAVAQLGLKINVVAVLALGISTEKQIKK
jgi:leucyl aminopeptidase